MKLNKVTITGVDETVTVEQLIDLSNHFPYVEWGILFSPSNQGLKPRYPNLEWIQDLIHKKLDYELENFDYSLNGNINLSAHLCGEFAKKILKGEMSIPTWLNVEFNRFQLNAVYPLVEVNKEKFWQLLEYKFQDKEIIFQLRNNKGNDQLFYETYEHFIGSDVKITGLVDNSGGKGKIIDKFPLYEEYPIGYAGGINNENLSDIVENILIQVGNESDKDFWIDMESGVRTINGDKDIFDLEKVKECLKFSNLFINQ